MRRTLLRSCIVTAGVLALPGCLAINALLGAAGLIVGGPVQYAATAYTVGEYTYHYAVNNKTPDEVIEEKFAWLTGSDEDTATTETVVAKSVTLDEVKPRDTGLHLAEVKLTGTPIKSESGLGMTKPAVVARLRPKAPTRSPSRTTRPARMPKPPLRETPPAASPVLQVQTKAAPEHTYVDHQVDPLLERLSRMEQGFAMAERLMNQEAENGIRVSLTSEDAGQTGSVNGSWSIRHPVMQTPPSPAASLVEAPSDSDHSSS